MDVFVDFIRTRGSTTTPAIETLEFTDSSYDGISHVEQFGEMITAPEHPTNKVTDCVCGGGGTLKTLILNCSGEGEDLFMALDADTCRLEREELVQYLPHFCYLRHLEAESCERGGDQDLLLALRQNGSLHSGQRHCNIASNSMKAYRERNRLAPLFLGSFPRDEMPTGPLPPLRRSTGICSLACFKW
jgi:hypothetical protein